MLKFSLALLATVALAAQVPAAPSIQRGKYLVQIGGCQDCHTPGSLLGKRDTSRTLGGSEVGFFIPHLGAFYGPNLTPDKETGIGTWTVAQIVTAITTGMTPEKRKLAPIMPYRDLAALKPDDATSIALYLKSLKPVHNKVPGPFGPDEKPTSFVMKVIPPGT